MEGFVLFLRVLLGMELERKGGIFIKILTKPNEVRDLEGEYLINFLALFQYERDRKDYRTYCRGSLSEFSEERLQEIKVLDTLIKLGFPEDGIGTYYYKEMIFKAVQYLNNGVDDLGIPISEDELLSQMQRPYSQFYLNIARYDLDVGIKTFHSHINSALKLVNYDSIDTTLLHDIYGNFQEETDYGKHALIIAKYVNSTLQGKDKKQYVKEMPLTVGACEQ